MKKNSIHDDNYVRMVAETLPTTIFKGNQLAKPNFQFEKRQKELAKKQKKEEKKQRKLEEKNPVSADQPIRPAGEEITG